MPTLLITGANRGIGLELTRQYLADNWQVIACCRHPEEANELSQLAERHSTLTVEQLDVTDHAAIDELAKKYSQQPFDILFNNAGIIGPVPVTEHIASQYFSGIDYDLWKDVLQVNTLAPIKMAEAFLTNVEASEQKKIVTISSTVGSIEEMNIPVIPYATSKTATNKAMSLLSSQLRERNINILLFCPGYVKTRLDFGTADVEISDSCAGLRQLVEESTMEHSGTFRRYTGETVAW